MFTISKDAELTADIISEAIKYNEKMRARYQKLENYYLGKHEILNRTKPLGSKNSKVVTNYAKYITTINTGYLLGNPVTYKARDEKIDISPILEEYQKQTISDLDAEIAKDLSIFGIQYELIYNDGNNVVSKDIDVRNAICVYDNTVQHKKMFGIIYEFGKDIAGKTFSDITVYSNKYKYVNCVDSKGEPRVGERKPHYFGKVPLIEYRNNSDYEGDFEQVISLIDAYNLLQSDRINDKQQLVEAILLGYGVSMTDKQKTDLRNNRMMFGLPVKGEANIEFLAKNLDETQVDILRKNIEEDIHKISLTPNMSDENFVGNASGVAIAYKLLPFDQNVKNKERFFEKGLMERLEIYKNYLVKRSKVNEFDVYKADAVFNRNLPQNLLELSQIVNNLRGIVDDETLVSQLPFVSNPKESIEQAKKEGLNRFIETVNNFGQGKPNVPEEE